jgi:hypothetical protein
MICVAGVAPGEGSNPTSSWRHAFHPLKINYGDPETGRPARVQIW